MNKIEQFITKLFALTVLGFVALSTSACSSLVVYQSAPKDIVTKYCEADFVGANTHTESWKLRIQPLTTWVDAPGWDYLVVVGNFTVGEMKSSKNQAEVIVEYEIIGKLNGHNFYQKKVMERIVYKLANKSTGWKINEPQPPPHVSINTALRLLEQSSISDEEHRTAIQDSISRLRKQMN